MIDGLFRDHCPIIIPGRLCPSQSVMAQILKEEILEFESDIEKQELIYHEIMEEADQWLYELMEMAEEIAIDQLLDGDNIFCPVCQKSNLECASEAVISCACGVRYGRRLP